MTDTNGANGITSDSIPRMKYFYNIESTSDTTKSIQSAILYKYTLCYASLPIVYTVTFSFNIDRSIRGHMFDKYDW